ncbi:MAG: class I SAM-dependent methyltransferase [Kiritimatiellae bacterium]|jgi:2-polyprenyl-3-methyl-5-hydroxy-6-metoxy-1,4-benzoquinol methylase|nr:class I SAM-dependent methyltransferase [Kiritimatiellia bacterium]
MLTKKYGWSSTEAPCSCDFVAPKIIQLLYTLGVSNVLDVGCGNGVLCDLIQRSGFTVTGAEPDKEGCELASRTYPNITFHHVGVCDSPACIIESTPDGFDCVVSTEVIEHLFSPQLLPVFASNVLIPSGYLVLSTPYHGFVKNLMLSLFDHWDAHHTVLWEGGHIKFWSRKTLMQLLEQNGFKVVSFHGVGRIPYLWKSMIIVAKKV